MPLEPPAALPVQTYKEVKMHRGATGWSTRFTGEKPTPLGSPGGVLYCRDPKTGWITGGSAYMPERSPTERQGFRYLDEYGEHEHNLHWLNNPFEMLLRFGGARELPVEQVQEQGWDRHPPMVDGEVIAFPQLEGIELDKIDCPFCFRALPSEKGKRSHITVMHADRVAADDLATGVTKGMSAALAQGRSTIAVAEAPAGIYRCEKPGCTRFFDSEQGKSMHMTKPHE